MIYAGAAAGGFADFLAGKAINYLFPRFSRTWSRHLPAIPIHHLEGHSAVADAGRSAARVSLVALLVSGGHTQLMRVDGWGRYELLGETLDDAAGEAFDKSAKLMGSNIGN